MFFNLMEKRANYTYPPKWVCNVEPISYIFQPSFSTVLSFQYEIIEKKIFIGNS